MRIVLTGGGTGGHVLPLEPLIEALRSQFIEQKDSLPARLDTSELQLTFVGVADEETRALFAQYDVPTINITAGKLRRYASVATITDTLFRLPISIITALIRMWRIMPDVVISKGGYGSLPVLIAAIFYRIPILLHESDVVPGMTNTKLLRFASAITVGFPGAKQYLEKWEYKIYVTGTPVRKQLTAVQQAEAKRTFEIAETESLLLVMGGSQGAQQLNEALLAILPEIIPDMAIIHITGKQHFQAVSTVAKELISHSPRSAQYKPYPYLGDTMAHALSAADGIVSRAGATSLAEIARLRKPSLLVPLASAANDHQRKNARVFESAGAALVLEPTNLGRTLFKQNIIRLMQDTELRQRMVSNVASLDYGNAARDISSLALKLASGFVPKQP